MKVIPLKNNRGENAIVKLESGIIGFVPYPVNIGEEVEVMITGHGKKTKNGYPTVLFLKPVPDNAKKLNIEGFSVSGSMCSTVAYPSDPNIRKFVTPGSVPVFAVDNVNITFREPRFVYISKPGVVWVVETSNRYVTVGLEYVEDIFCVEEHKRSFDIEKYKRYLA